MYELRRGSLVAYIAEKDGRPDIDTPFKTDIAGGRTNWAAGRRGLSRELFCVLVRYRAEGERGWLDSRAVAQKWREQWAPPYSSAESPSLEELERALNNARTKFRLPEAPQRGGHLIQSQTTRGSTSWRLLDGVEVERKDDLPAGSEQSTSSRLDFEYIVSGRPKIPLIYVPGGTFRMGRESTERGDERPTRIVHLSPFVIGKYPITNDEYSSWSESIGDEKRASSFFELNGQKPALEDYKARFCRKNQPLVGVSPDEFAPFLKWLGLGLPTEAQWEYACLGGRPDRFPWGNSVNGGDMEAGEGPMVDILKVPSSGRGDAKQGLSAPQDGNPRPDPLPDQGPKDVDDKGLEKGRSWCGCYGMVGGVWEWCSDNYGPYPSNEEWDPVGPPDSAAVMGEKVEVDHGVARGQYKVLRGGSFLSPGDVLGATLRGANFTYWRNCCDGFRVAAPVNWDFLRRYLQIGDHDWEPPDRKGERGPISKWDILDWAKRERAQLQALIVKAHRDWLYNYRLEHVGPWPATMPDERAAAILKALRERKAEMDDEMGELRNRCLERESGRVVLDGELTVFSRSGSVELHRFPKKVEAEFRDGDHDLGVNLHALVMSRIGAQHEGTVCWVDALEVYLPGKHRDIEPGKDEGSKSQSVTTPGYDKERLRFTAAGFLVVPGTDLIVIVERHLHQRPPDGRRQEWIQWFSRAGWYIWPKLWLYCPRRNLTLPTAA